MKRLFNYCFYRIALFYKKHLPFEDYITQGHTLLISILGFYIIALSNIILHLLGIVLSKQILIVILIPFCIVIVLNNRIFHNSEQLFSEMKKDFENEQLKWIKGGVVFLFVLGSIISLFFSFHFFPGVFNR